MINLPDNYFAVKVNNKVVVYEFGERCEVMRRAVCVSESEAYRWCIRQGERQ